MRNLIVFTLALYTAPSFCQAAESRYEVFPGSTSPSKRYALAWGIRGRQAIDFKRAKDDFEYRENLIDDDKHPVENYIVDERSHQIIRTIQSSQKYPEMSHGGVNVSWDPRERFAVVTPYGKWQTEAVVFVGLPGSGVSAQVDILQAMERALQTELHARGKFYTGKRVDESVTTVDVDRVTQQGQVCFRLDRTAPKDDRPTVFQGLSIYTVRTDARRINVTPGDIRGVRDRGCRLQTTYAGTIGRNLAVEMRLTEEPILETSDGDTYSPGMKRTGSYFYLSDHQALSLSDAGKQTATGGEQHGFHLIERDSGTVTGGFVGDADSSGVITGTWRSADGKRSLPFRLVPRSMNWVR